MGEETAAKGAPRAGDGLRTRTRSTSGQKNEKTKVEDGGSQSSFTPGLKEGSRPEASVATGTEGLTIEAKEKVLGNCSV